MSKKKILAIILFVFIGLFMFTYANPAEPLEPVVGDGILIELNKNTADTTNKITVDVNVKTDKVIDKIVYGKGETCPTDGSEIKLEDGKGSFEVSENGTYIVCVTTEDGETESEVIVIDNIDKTGPRLVVSPKLVRILLGTNYDVMTGVRATDNSGVASLTVSLTDTTVLPVGEHVITYTATDNLGNTRTDTRTIKVYDPDADDDNDGFTNKEELEGEPETNPDDENSHPETVAPVIEAKDLVIEVFDEFKEDVTVTLDSHDTITVVEDALVITGEVDTKKLGTYTLTYSITDRYGKTVEVERTVEVVDTKKPEITLDNEVTIRTTDTFIDTYTAVDNYDGDITSKVVVTGKVENGVKGDYELTYTVKDSSDNETVVVRTVHVVSVEELKEAIKEGSEIIDNTKDKEVREDLKDLLEELEKAIEEGNKVIDDKDATQDEVDEKTKEIEEIIEKIKNLTFKVTFVDYNNEVLKEQDVKYAQNATAPENPTRLGYAFDKWNGDYTNIFNDVTITATYTVRSFTAEFYIDNKLCGKVENVEFGAAITVPSTCIASAGYTLSAWTPEVGNMTAEGMRFDATTTANKDTKYVVNHYQEDLNGNNVLVETNALKAETDTTVTATAKTYEGFTVVEPLDSKTVNGDGTTELNVYYKRNTHTVTFKVGEEVISSTSYKFGATVNTVAEPTKAGYTFSGWSKVPATMPNEDVVVTGTFTANKNTSYKVNHYQEDLNGENVLVETEALTAETDTLVKATAKEYNGFTVVEPLDSKTVNGNGTTELNAYYKRNTHTVTFKVGEEVIASATYKFGATVNIVAEPTKAGYTFSGWSKVPATMPNEDVVVTGTFTANKNTSYKVNHYLENVDNNEYTLDTTEDLTAETDTLVKATVKEYNGFTVVEPLDQATVNGNGTTELNVYYKRNTHTVTFKVGEEVISSTSYKFGATVNKVAEPTKLGYTFSGWNEVPATMPNEDVVVTGTFTANTNTAYTVVINKENLDGTMQEVSNEVLTNGTTLEELTVEAPSYKGFTLAEDTVLTKTIAADGSTVFTLNYIRNVYTVKFVVNGEVYNTQEVKFEGSAERPEDPTVENYEFVKWVEDYTNVKSDLTVNAELKAELKEIKLEKANSNVNLAWQRGTENVDIKQYVKVTKVYWNGTEEVANADEFRIDGFATGTTGTYEMTAVLNENNMRSNVLEYKITDKFVYDTLFEVTFNNTGKYSRTSNRDCTSNCDKGNNVSDVTGVKFNFLEITERYDELLSVDEVSIKYAGEEGRNTLETSASRVTGGFLGLGTKQNLIRWESSTRTATHGPVKIAAGSLEDPSYDNPGVYKNGTDAVPAGKTIDKVYIKYRIDTDDDNSIDDEEYKYVVFERQEDGSLKAIDEKVQ